MGRHKQEIKKSKHFIVRVEPAIKKQYSSFCRKNKFIVSKRIMEFILNDMKC